LILSGLQELGDHVFWYKGFNFYFGAPVVHPTLDLIFWGTGFLLAGIAIVVTRK
jgi:hypothetical protein